MSACIVVCLRPPLDGGRLHDRDEVCFLLLPCGQLNHPSEFVPRAGAKDANADGRTTRSEAKKANVDLSDPRDLNDDGKVTRSEAHAVENARARGQLP